MFNTLASFELTTEIAKEFINAKSIPMPEGVLIFPFKEFCITFPITALNNGIVPKPIIDTLVRKHGDVKSTIHVIEEGDGYIITMYSNTNKLVTFRFSPELPNNGIETIETKLNQKMARTSSILCLLLMQGVMSHYLSPTTIIKKDEVRESRATSPLRDYKSPSKKYIYKTRYVFAGKKQLPEPTEEPRTYERHADAWLVNGHIRRYRDADGNVLKEVYIKPYKKGTGALKTQEYKITRL